MAASDGSLLVLERRLHQVHLPLAYAVSCGHMAPLGDSGDDVGEHRGGGVVGQPEVPGDRHQYLDISAGVGCVGDCGGEVLRPGTMGDRVGYVSASTMLEAREGDTVSYLDIGAVIEEVSPAATADLRQLWRRVAFGILISNTDDHLRNHGFLHAGASAWALSPAFDLNPNPDPPGAFQI